MRVYTVHIRPGRAPVLVREGFAWGGLLLGPVWLAARRALIPAVLALAAIVAILLLAPGAAAKAILMAALAFFLGISGHDMVRFALDLRGYGLVHVIAAPGADMALARLLALRPDTAEALAR